MKDTKIVILIGVPLVAVAGGLFVASRNLSSERKPAGSSRGREEADPGRPRYGEPVPRSEWPREAAVRGNPRLLEPGRRPPPEPGGEEHLTLELLRELLAKGDQQAWQRIFDLLRIQNGKIDDPVAAAELLVGVLDDDWNNAVWVPKVLALLKDEAALARAAENLLSLAGETKDPQALKGAFLALGRIGRGEDVAGLGDLARRMETDELANAAILAIGEIGTAESARELARLLVDRRGTGLEHTIVRAMGRVGSAEMVAELRPFLRSDQPAELMRSALRALGLTRSPAAVGPLAEFVASDADRSLKDEALKGLGNVGNRAATEELLRIRKEDPELGFAAGLALRNVERVEALDPLLREIDGERDVRVKSAMIDGIGNMGSAAREKAAAKLRGYLESGKESQSVRGRSARALAKLGDVEAIEVMARVLERPGSGEANLKMEITSAAQELAGRPRAVPVLVEKMVPVLRRIVERRKEDVVYFRAVLALHMIEAATPRGGK